MKRFTLFYLTYKRFLGKRIYLLIILTFFVSILDGFGITMILPLIHSLSPEFSSSENTLLIQAADFLGVMGSMNKSFVLITIIFLTKSFVFFIRELYAAHLSKILYFKLKKTFFNNLELTNIQYLNTTGSGKIIEVLNIHSNQTAKSFQFFITFITNFITFISYTFFALLVSIETTLYIIPIVPLLYIVFKKLNNYIAKYSLNISDQSKQVATYSLQFLDNFKYLTLTNTVNVIRSKFIYNLKKLVRTVFKMRVLIGFSKSIKDLVSILFILLLIYLEIIYFENSYADLIVLVLIFHKIANYGLSLQISWQSVIDKYGFVKSFNSELINMKINMNYQNGDVIYDSSKSENKHIQLKEIKFSYSGSNSNILDGINIDIEPNSSIAIVGVSGSGKSTIANLIAGLIFPNKGEIIIGETKINELDLASWRKKIGFVTQDAQLFDGTFSENISLFDKNVDKELMEKTCVKLGIHQFIMSEERGYDTGIGDKGTLLSGGQKQRICIAREIYKKPDLIIFDEATSALDIEAKLIVKDVIDNLNCSVIFITHNIELLEKVDYIYHIYRGKVIEKGSYEHLKINSKEFSKHLKKVKSN